MKKIMLYLVALMVALGGTYAFVEGTVDLEAEMGGEDIEDIAEEAEQVSCSLSPDPLMDDERLEFTIKSACESFGGEFSLSSGWFWGLMFQSASCDDVPEPYCPVLNEMVDSDPEALAFKSTWYTTQEDSIYTPQDNLNISNDSDEMQAEETLGGSNEEACPMVYQPVCGVDGETYGNECVARVNEVEIEHEGECEDDVVEEERSVNLPLVEGEDYNLLVKSDSLKSEDGVVEINSYEDNTIVFEEPGEHEIEIVGLINGWNFAERGDPRAIKEISNWGMFQFGEGGGYFKNAENLEITAQDRPGVQETTDFSDMFRNAISLEEVPGLEEWHVSHVEDMSGMFAGTSIDQNIGGWDVSSVEDMSEMFYRNNEFNQDISEWDVSNVEDMSEMFRSADNFNQEVGGWDVSSVEDMNGMFAFSEFNQDISEWDVSNVEDMSEMFSHVRSFNQDISSWDTSNVEDMSRMFWNANDFNQDVGEWDVSSVEDMSKMFQLALSFNQDLNQWDTSNVEDMSMMFWNAELFSGEIGNWDVSNVEDMRLMFREARSFNSDIKDWEVGSVEDMTYMFDDATAYQENLNNWTPYQIESTPSGFKSPQMSYTDLPNLWLQEDYYQYLSELEDNYQQCVEETQETEEEKEEKVDQYKERLESLERSSSERISELQNEVEDYRENNDLLASKLRETTNMRNNYMQEYRETRQELSEVKAELEETQRELANERRGGFLGGTIGGIFG